jgi:hypothetical protein
MRHKQTDTRLLNRDNQTVQSVFVLEKGVASATWAHIYIGQFQRQINVQEVHRNSRV